MNKLTALLTHGFRAIYNHPQFLLTLLLVLVIPIGFLVSAEQFSQASKKNQERLEKDRIGLLHDVFVSYLRAVAFDPVSVQEEIESLAALNPDITKFRVAKTEQDEIVPIAALKRDEIGTPETSRDAYLLAQARPDESIITPYMVDDMRYWQSFRLVTTPDAGSYYIFTETSLAAIDNLFAARIRAAYMWLSVILIIVLALVIRHVRLIDYSYLYRKAQRANEEKDMFTNMVAHELRTPLTVIRGYASMIREDTTVAEPVQSQASKIEEAAERLVLIVSDLLDVARIQSGKLTVVKENVSLEPLVASVIQTLQEKAGEKNITLNMEGFGNKPVVVGDEKRLYQALVNLVSNAIKYTREGSITVALQDRRDRVELRVKDTGMGIAAADQKELFAPFFRVADDDVSKITGTGLGMWITKQFIELMGGSIGVESIKGVGTHVVVTIQKVPGPSSVQKNNRT